MPLVDGKWLDRHVVELGEAGAILLKRAFTFEIADDNRTLAWDPAAAAHDGAEAPREMAVEALAGADDSRSLLGQFQTKLCPSGSFVHVLADLAEAMPVTETAALLVLGEHVEREPASQTAHVAHHRAPDALTVDGRVDEECPHLPFPDEGDEARDLPVGLVHPRFGHRDSRLLDLDTLRLEEILIQKVVSVPCGT